MPITIPHNQTAVFELHITPVRSAFLFTAVKGCPDIVSIVIQRKGQERQHIRIRLLKVVSFHQRHDKPGITRGLRIFDELQNIAAFYESVIIIIVVVGVIISVRAPALSRVMPVIAAFRNGLFFTARRNKRNGDATVTIA